MATHEYECVSCKHSIERKFSIHKIPPETIKCPACGKRIGRVFHTGYPPMLKSGREFLGDIWDKKCDVQPGMPEYEKLIAEENQYKRELYKEREEDIKKKGNKNV